MSTERTGKKSNAGFRSQVQITPIRTLGTNDLTGKNVLLGSGGAQSVELGLPQGIRKHPSFRHDTAKIQKSPNKRRVAVATAGNRLKGTINLKKHPRRQTIIK